MSGAAPGCAAQVEGVEALTFSLRIARRYLAVRRTAGSPAASRAAADSQEAAMCLSNTIESVRRAHD
jgi:hypothetical protein